MPGSVEVHTPTAWSKQQQYGQSAPAAGSAELSMPWAAPGINLPFPYGQSLHGGALHSGTHAGGARLYPNGFINTLSTGVTPSSPQHWSGESPSYTPVNALNATVATLTPPNHQVTSAMAVNTAGDNIAAPPAGCACVAVLSLIDLGALSRTKTGRSGPKRGVPGRTFEPDLETVQQRLRREGADAGAVEFLRSDVFPDGTITRAALKLPMSPDQRRGRNGTQKYMLLVEIVPRSHREVDHRCLLCPSHARVEFKNREDTLRHLYKDHFGLSVDCDDW